MAIFANDTRELVLNRLNAANTPVIPFTKNNVYFGIPKLETDGTSTVHIAGVLGSEYGDYSSVKYRRINFTKAFDSVPNIRAVYAPTLHELLPALSIELGLPLNPEDIVDSDISLLNPGEEVNIEIMATPGSLSYTGKFITKYQRLRLALSVALAKNELDELNHLPAIPEEQRSLTMAMYSIDFTVDKQWLRLWGNNWWYPDKVKEIAAQNGFPNWPSAVLNTVRDSSTKDEVLSNKSFDRVIIQKNVTVGSFTGDAYFHYNLT